MSNYPPASVPSPPLLFPGDVRTSPLQPVRIILVRVPDLSLAIQPAVDAIATLLMACSLIYCAWLVYGYAKCHSIDMSHGRLYISALTFSEETITVSIRDRPEKRATLLWLFPATPAKFGLHHVS